MPARRALHLVLLLITVLSVCFTASGQIPGQNERSRRIGKRLMCMCGCNQVLVECNHVGCSMSTAMLQKLDERVARNEPDDLILQSFIQEYGQKVLAQPPSSGFGLSAWVTPFAVLIAGASIIFVVLRNWRRGAPSPSAPGGPANISEEMLERARRETED